MRQIVQQVDSQTSQLGRLSASRPRPQKHWAFVSKRQKFGVSCGIRVEWQEQINLPWVMWGGWYCTWQWPQHGVSGRLLLFKRWVRPKKVTDRTRTQKETEKTEPSQRETEKIEKTTSTLQFNINAQPNWNDKISTVCNKIQLYAEANWCSLHCVALNKQEIQNRNFFFARKQYFFWPREAKSQGGPMKVMRVSSLWRPPPSAAAFLSKEKGRFAQGGLAFALTKRTCADRNPFLANLEFLILQCSQTHSKPERKGLNTPGALRHC